MGSSGRAERGGQSVLRAVLTVSAFTLLSSTALASVPEVGANPLGITFEQAMSSYETGDAASALMKAKEAAATDQRAALLAGHILRRGETGAPNYAGAVNWYEKAANMGNDDAMVALGEMAIKGQGGLAAEQAADWFTKAAQVGRTDAMRALADMYMKGVGVRASKAEGFEWMRNAADQGDVLAARRMGDYYIDTQPETALNYYEAAAKLGDPESAYFAGIMYAENLAITPNAGKTESYLKQASLAGHPAAMADYGLLVFMGAGEGTQEAAASWFAKAAHAGDDQGKFFYAYSLAKGEGVARDMEHAYYWLLKTNPSGVPEYDQDVKDLRTRLENNVPQSVLEKARLRAGKS